MNKSLLTACGLALACAASAQPSVGTGVAGSLSSSGATSNYGAGASPTFGAGARMNGTDFRAQGGVQPNATTPDVKQEIKQEANKVENKRDQTEDKVDRKVDKATQ